MNDRSAGKPDREKARERERRYRKTHREELLRKNREYQKTHRDEIRERHRRNYLARREEILEGKRPHNEEVLEERARKARQSREQVRAEVFRWYGEKCACCGSTDKLTIDHIGGGGAEHRKTLGYAGAGVQFYRWLRRNGFPDGYQTLCMRCNRSKSTGQRCRLPHRSLR